MIKGRLTEIILIASAMLLTACLIAFSVCESSKVTQAEVIYNTDAVEVLQNTQSQGGEVQNDIFSDEAETDETKAEVVSQTQTAPAAAANDRTKRTAAGNGNNSAAKTHASTVKTTRASKTATTKFSGVLNINTASVDELTQLNGIGEVIAQRIVDYRNQNGAFRAVEDIMNVKGIGEKKFAKIKPQICV